MRLASIHIHPLKSARGIAVDRARVEPRGLAHDRRFMLVDGHGRFLSQRTQPRLTLVTLAIGADRLEARAPGRAPIDWPLVPEGAPRRVEIWGDTCDAVSVSAGADRWFSEFLGVPCALVYLPDSSRRPVDPEYAPLGAHVSFADGFPFLLISRASLDALNARLTHPIAMERFRPNFVVDGCGPFAEDEWRDLTIGGLRFCAVKPCARCSIPNVDPETAAISHEPIHALAGFRTVDKKVLFGQNLLGPGAGELAVGGAVEIISRR